jgi:hypothetical protein
LISSGVGLSVITKNSPSIETNNTLKKQGESILRREWPLFGSDFKGLQRPLMGHVET